MYGEVRLQNSLRELPRTILQAKIKSVVQGILSMALGYLVYNRPLLDRALSSVADGRALAWRGAVTLFTAGLSIYSAIRAGQTFASITSYQEQQIQQGEELKNLTDKNEALHRFYKERGITKDRTLLLSSTFDSLSPQCSNMIRLINDRLQKNFDQPIDSDETCLAHKRNVRILPTDLTTEEKAGRAIEILGKLYEHGLIYTYTLSYEPQGPFSSLNVQA
jgi:hypothetical protein